MADIVENEQLDGASNASALRKPKRSVLKGAGSLVGFFCKLGLVLAFVATGLLVGGFLKFASTVTALETPASVRQADGIVVLTGGASRIDIALGLLDLGRAKRLLISGVNPVTSQKALERVTNSRPKVFDCCVDIGRRALDTRGNANETADWAKKLGYNSLIVVTSDYHMPRSMLELKRTMPEMPMQAAPVPMADLRKADWFLQATTLRVMVSEYFKFLAAHIRLALGDNTYDSIHASMMG